MKTTLSLLAIIVSLSIAGLFLISQNKKLQHTNTRYYTNIKNMADYAVITKNELGQSIAQVGVLQLSLQEAKETNLLQQAEIKKLKIRPKDIKSQNATHTTTEIYVPVMVQDSISNKCFNYTDTHLTISGCVTDTTGYVQAQLQDTLTTTVHIERKRLLWIIRYGIKNTKATTTNTNPYVAITNTKYLEIIR